MKYFNNLKIKKHFQQHLYFLKNFLPINNANTSENKKLLLEIIQRIKLMHILSTFNKCTKKLFLVKLPDLILILNFLGKGGLSIKSRQKV